VRAGDLAAFEQLVTRYQLAVFNIAYYKSKNAFDAEDLAQDIFLAAYRALGTLRDRDNFAGWLFGIAYNRCHKWYRRERGKVVVLQEVRRRLEEERRLASRAERAGGGAEDGQEPAVADFLSRLPEELRSVLGLKYLEGLDYEEISKRLGIKAHRIDYLIRKGKKMIRERWGILNRESRA
jgi:RNA polymerase sigma-70 factor (ECF subfamily)